MAELIHNPSKLEKARSEITKLMENKKKIIQESDIPQLPYLQAVIKETLRLHPPAPFLVPHQAIHDVEMASQCLKTHKSSVMCGQLVETQNFGHIQKCSCQRGFWNSRLTMEAKTLSSFHLVLGKGYNFDWKLEGNMRAQDMDMGERPTLQRNVPLK
ncbi:putative geraniol 8-hydroxylase [Helianthus annuus]|nr:putative geraniol 8-hydroxylase [Helianthus annuus]